MALTLFFLLSRHADPIAIGFILQVDIVFSMAL